jgi:uncharacterized lipoprotein YddW (UPF0748 family)
MKRIVNLIFIFMAVSGVCIGSDAIPIRAVQVFNLSSPDIVGLKSEFAQLKAAGFNTIIFRIFKNPYDSRYKFVPEAYSSGVYYQSVHEPVVADALSPVISTAHGLGMKVFAWVTTRKSQWILNENPSWDSPKLDLHSGQQLPGGQLDVFRTDVETRLSNMLTELAVSGVDGILFQDDFVSRHSEDLFTNAWRSFHGSTFHPEHVSVLFDLGRKPTGYRPEYYRWARHKSKSLAMILNRLISRVKRVNPAILVAVNLYYEVAISPHNGRLWLSQDLEEWSKIPVDFWAIMAYQRQMSGELNLSIEAISSKLQVSRTHLHDGFLIPPASILWKLQIQDWQTGEKVSNDEFSMFFNSFSPEQFVLVPYRGIENAQTYGSTILTNFQ